MGNLAVMANVDVLLRSHAIELGFDRVGVASAMEPLTLDVERYEAFIDAGFHGSMAYLAEHRDVRRSAANPGILGGARSIVCVAERYAVREDARHDQAGIVSRIARYARGRDYHNHMRRRLRKLAAFVRSLGDGVEARPLCDTAPLLERAWASRAGLGFVGKNGMLICPGIGSYVLLGEVVTNLVLEPDVPERERCGRCTRCLDACPTSAFVRPHVLDARRCMSYLTIEHRGRCDPGLESAIAPRLFGCDTCQEVCPFNRPRAAYIDPGGPFDTLPQWREWALPRLLSADPASWSAQLAGSPLKRAHPTDWVRNALMACAPNEAPDVLARVRALVQDPQQPRWIHELASDVAIRLERSLVALPRDERHGDR